MTADVCQEKIRLNTQLSSCPDGNSLNQDCDSRPHQTCLEWVAFIDYLKFYTFPKLYPTFASNFYAQKIHGSIKKKETVSAKPLVVMRAQVYAFFAEIIV